MMRSLFAAVSGLRNHQVSLDVIGNNIANINTIGFKTGRAVFQEMLSQTIQGASRPSATHAGTNPVQIGLGMSVAAISNNFGQGSLQLTGNMLDMAVQGEGFFVMRNGDREYFGRAGAFGFDGEGRLTAGQGLLVQGWIADDMGNIGSSSALQDLMVPFGQKSPARATESIRLSSNLDASAEALNTITQTASFRAMGQATDSLQTMFDSTGRTLGVQDGDVLRLTYSGTADTLVSDLSTEDGSRMDLVAGDVITVSDGSGSTFDITYQANWTLNTLAQQVENTLNVDLGTETDISVSINPDGSLLFTNPAGGNDADLTVTLFASGRNAFNSLVAGIPVINGTSTARSARTIVEQSIPEGTQFQNVNDLANAIQSAMSLGSAGVSVSYVNGRFAYDNSAGSRDLFDVQISRPGSSGVFTDAMGLDGTSLSVGSTLQSDLLLDTATETDDLANLYDARGVSFGLTTGSVFTFAADISGQPMSPATFTVVNTGDGSNSDRAVQTLGGLLVEMEDTLALTTAGGVDLTDGAIVVSGRAGLSQELTNLAFSQTGNSSLTASASFTEVQAATDVTHEASIRVFDALGSSHLLSMIFTKDNDTDNRWTWEATHETGQVTAGGTGSVTFRGDGTLESFTSDDGSPLTVDPATGASGPIVINIDAGAPGGVEGITGFARESTTAIVDQDGYTMGMLESIAVDQDGVLTGVFTNGTSRALAQIALATFNNADGLQREGENGWRTTANSGQAIVRRPGTSTEVGAISAGTLEMSNVDIAQEFTNMIIAQRGFQANARTISTSDEMLQELVNLKR